jgi:hypothetical protein
MDRFLFDGVKIDIFDEHHLGNILFDFYDPNPIILDHRSSYISPDGLYYKTHLRMIEKKSYKHEIYKLNGELYKSITSYDYLNLLIDFVRIMDNKLYIIWENWKLYEHIITITKLNTGQSADLIVKKTHPRERIIDILKYQGKFIILTCSSIYITDNKECKCFSTHQGNLCSSSIIVDNKISTILRKEGVIVTLSLIDYTITKHQSIMCKDLYISHFIRFKNFDCYHYYDRVIVCGLYNFTINLKDYYPSEEVMQKIRENDGFGDDDDDGPHISKCIVNEYQTKMAVEIKYGDWTGQRCILTINLKNGKVIEKLEMEVFSFDFVFPNHKEILNDGEVNLIGTKVRTIQPIITDFPF